MAVCMLHAAAPQRLKFQPNQTDAQLVPAPAHRPPRAHTRWGQGVGSSNPHHHHKPPARPPRCQRRCRPAPRPTFFTIFCSSTRKARTMRSLTTPAARWPPYARCTVFLLLFTRCREEGRTAGSCRQRTAAQTAVMSRPAAGADHPQTSGGAHRPSAAGKVETAGVLAAASTALFRCCCEWGSPRSGAGQRWGRWGGRSSSWPAGTPACHLHLEATKRAHQQLADHSCAKGEHAACKEMVRGCSKACPSHGHSMQQAPQGTIFDSACHAPGVFTIRWVLLLEA